MCAGLGAWPGRNVVAIGAVDLPRLGDMKIDLGWPSGPPPPSQAKHAIYRDCFQPGSHGVRIPFMPGAGLTLVRGDNDACGPKVINSRFIN